MKHENFQGRRYKYNVERISTILSYATVALQVILGTWAQNYFSLIENYSLVRKIQSLISFVHQ